MQTLNIKQFNRGVAIAICIAVVLFYFSSVLGNNGFFLLLNADLGVVADYIFYTLTYFGDALVWIGVLFIMLFVLKQKKAWPLVLSAFVISTIITQLFKNIWPNALRPWKAIQDHSLIHHAAFVKPWLLSSFPSGHTGTAFTVYLIFCLWLPNKWWLWVGLVYALLVGYSRVYLAQHFPVDVAAGIVVGVISASISMFIQITIMKKWWKLRLSVK